MQYMGLSSNEQERFKLKQASGRRKPTFSVWIDGLDFVESCVTSIMTDTGIEESYGAEHFKVGTADLQLTNEDETFYSSSSLIDKEAEIRIWAGFDELIIPIFAGYVDKVQPAGSNAVAIHCKDNMGHMLHKRLEGDQGDNDTLNEMVEYFCDELGLLSDVPNTAETDRELESTYFYEQTFYTAMKNLCDHFFAVVWFNERGRLQFKERERSNQASWTFRDGTRGNVRDVIRMADSDIVNAIGIEYRDYFVCRAQDSDSIDTYRERERIYRLSLMDSEEISSLTAGTTDNEVTTDEAAIKFTSPSDAEVIDCIHLMLAQSDAEGEFVVKIYDDSSAEPNSLLATSRKKDAKDLIAYSAGVYSWAVIEFDNALEIDPDTVYWCSLDVTGLTDGSIYWQGSTAACTTNYGTYSGDRWTVVGNENRKHKIYGSGMANEVTEDMVAFYKDPRERLQVIAPAVPQLQMMDEVLVDIEGPPRYLGAYVVEARRHIITPWEYTTVDVLREA